MTTKGPLTTKARNSLPNWAFALPKTRAYPLYRPGKDGKPIPSRSHAINAKARATQHASSAQQKIIVAKANKILARTAKGRKIK
jgi:hypothetical protein